MRAISSWAGCLPAASPFLPVYPAPSELVDLGDVENAVKLLVALVQQAQPFGEHQ
jgi:hypothetical protein